MTTITLTSPLAAELEQVANEQAIQPEKLLEEAVRSYLRGLERDKIKAEAAAFRRLHPELVKQYLGRYVAIRGRSPGGGGRQIPECAPDPGS